MAVVMVAQGRFPLPFESVIRSSSSRMPALLLIDDFCPHFVHNRP